MMAIVTWLLSSKLGRILLGAVAILGAFFAFKLWLAAHDASVASQARSGYVLLAEKTTAEAQSKELKRQLDAANQSITAFQAKYSTAKQEETKAKLTLEQEIKSYELQLSEKNRTCALSSDDAIWLQHNGAPQPSRK